jgi:tight adherence protein C
LEGVKKVIKIISGILVGIGIFLIVVDFLRIPYVKTSKAINNLSKRQKKKTSSIELWLKDLAICLSKRLKFNEYKRMQLVSDLQTANMNITPELHIAKAIIKAGICGLLTIPAFFIFPLIVPFVLALAITMYFKESKGIQEKIKKRRAAIEFELPRLVFTIEKTLSHSRDVLTILDTYRENAGAELKYELSITVADMRSGNYEAALTRLESRVGSAMLSDVVRGLISVLRGDNTSVFWASLSVKFADIQRQQLKLLAQKVPSKLKRLSMILLFCFMAVYLVVIISQVMTSLGAMF